MEIKELKKAVSEKEKICIRSVEYRAEKVKKNYGPFSNEIAYGIVAQQAGICVSKYIQEEEIMGQIRGQIDRIKGLGSLNPKPKTRTIIRTKVVKIGDEIKLTDPILEQSVISDAKEMTKVYAQIYVFENSVRAIINLVFSKNIGKDWWKRPNINKDLLEKIQKRIDKEDENPWHGKRGAHPIYYTDILDLSYLIRKFWEGNFDDIFPRCEWITEKLEQVSISRNVIDHHNPLNSDDRQRLSVIFKDWHRQINANKEKFL